MLRAGQACRTIRRPVHGPMQVTKFGWGLPRFPLDKSPKPTLQFLHRDFCRQVENGNVFSSGIGSLTQAIADKRVKLLFIVPEASFFLSHRLPLAKAALTAGYDVSIACPPSPAADDLAQMNIAHLPLPMPRGARNLPGELKSLYQHYRLLKSLRPDLVHLVTAKPMLYGGLAAKILNIPSVSAVTGLGFVFIRNDLKARVLRQIIKLGYRIALNRPRNHVIFQNPDDRDLFEKMGLISRCQVSLIPGSGVDLDVIKPQPLPSGPPLVLMPCRMLKDKGVVEFVNAARMLKAKGVDATFRLLGDPDPGNPTSVTHDELTEWVREGVVEWRPHSKDINTELAEAHIVALPSYREGFPKSLVDAAAAGRAAVTSDVPGCRHAIIPGETGLLFKVCDAGDLAIKLEQLLPDRDAITKMGAAARRLAETRYDIARIAADHLEIYDRILKLRRG